MEMKWEGLADDADKIAQLLNIHGLFDQNVNKHMFKNIVKKACSVASNEQLTSDISKYKKMSALRSEVSKGNQYFHKETIQNARMLFRFRVELFAAKMNFKYDHQYKSENYLCDSCETQTDENIHVLFCPAY